MIGRARAIGIGIPSQVAPTLRLVRVVAVTLAAALAAVTAGDAPRAETKPAAATRAVFVQSYWTGSRYTGPPSYLCAAAPGAQPMSIPGRNHRVAMPEFSPDGWKVAYVGDGGSIQVASPDGSDAQRVAFGDEPAWMPDGLRLVYSRYDGESGTSELVIQPIRGGPPTGLTAGGDDRRAAVSPDGSRIAFDRLAGGRSTLHLLTLADGSLRQLGEGSAATWAPDGRTIVYSTARAGPLRVLDVDSSAPSLPLAGTEGGGSPALSPDGTTLLFARSGDIWLVRANGGEARNLTHSPVQEADPTWQHLGTDTYPAGSDVPCVIAGTPGRERLVGSKYTDTFFDGAGDDVIVGGRGADVVFDADGDDRIDGGPGDDHVVLRKGRNTVHAGTGADHVHELLPPTNRLSQRIDGGPGDDRLRGGPGSDVLIGGGGADLLHGDAGNDRFYARDGQRDRIAGGIGTDLAFADRSDRVVAVERRHPARR
jgi:RTX calcium-binding nonapeptide repeat (4 copies)/WD40-like Beta Propeller Repeat